MGASLAMRSKPEASVGTTDQPKAVTLYEKVKNEIEELRNSIDTTPADALLKKVRLAIDIKDYSSAEEYVKECIQKTHELKKSYEKAADSLKTAWPRIKQARDGGVDVTRSNELIKEARKALRAKQCQKSLELANLAVDLLLTPLERKKRKCDELRERINTIMDGVKTFGEIKGVGLLLVHEADTLISKAERGYNSEEYDNAMQLFKKSEKSLGQLKQQYLYKQADNIYSHAESMINEMEKSGKTVPGTAMALLKAKDALDYEDYDEVIYHAVQIKKSIDKWEGERSDEDAIQAISKAQFILADLRKTDADMGDIEDLFQQAKDAFEEKDFAKAEELALKVGTTGVELKNDEHRKKATVLLNDVKNNLSDLSESVDTGRLEDQLVKAQTAFDSAEFMKSIQILKRLAPQITKSKDKALIPKIEMRIKEASMAIQTSKGLGLSTLQPENWLRQANFAFENKQFDEVTTLADRIINFFKKEKKETVEKVTMEYKKLIPEAMKAVQKIRDQKWDVKPLVEKLKKAPALLKGKKYDELEKVTVEVKNEANRILGQEIIGPAKEILEETQTAFNEAKEKNVDVVEIEPRLSEAMKLFSEKKYSLIREKVEPILEFLREEEKKISIHRAEIIFEFSEKIINAYNKWGIGVTKHKKMLQKGMKALADKKADEAIDVARELDKGLKESRLKFLTKKTVGALKTAKAFVKKSKSEKEGEANELLAKAQKQLDDGEIIRAWNTALESRKVAGIEEKDFFKLKCDMTNTILLPKIIELRSSDMDISEIEKEYGEYENTYKEQKDYAKGYEMISKVADDAHDIEQFFITRKAIDSVGDILKGYAMAGVKTDPIDELVNNARVLLDEKKFKDSLHAVEDAIQKADELKDNILAAYSPDEKTCDTCKYPVIIFEPFTTPEVKCPVCAASIDVALPPPME